jgi:hypothetical protein
MAFLRVKGGTVEELATVARKRNRTLKALPEHHSPVVPGVGAKATRTMVTRTDTGSRNARLGASRAELRRHSAVNTRNVAHEGTGDSRHRVVGGNATTYTDRDAPTDHLTAANGHGRWTEPRKVTPKHGPWTSHIR